MQVISLGTGRAVTAQEQAVADSRAEVRTVEAQQYVDSQGPKGIKSAQDEYFFAHLNVTETPALMRDLLQYRIGNYVKRNGTQVYTIPYKTKSDWVKIFLSHAGLTQNTTTMGTGGESDSKLIARLVSGPLGTLGGGVGGVVVPANTGWWYDAGNGNRTAGIAWGELERLVQGAEAAGASYAAALPSPVTLPPSELPTVTAAKLAVFGTSNIKKAGASASSSVLKQETAQVAAAYAAAGSPTPESVAATSSRTWILILGGVAAAVVLSLGGKK